MNVLILNEFNLFIGLNYPAMTLLNTLTSHNDNNVHPKLLNAFKLTVIFILRFVEGHSKDANMDQEKKQILDNIPICKNL